MILAFDLDGVITNYRGCKKRSEIYFQDFWCWRRCTKWDCPVTPLMKNAIDLLKARGHTIWIYTGRIKKESGKFTEAWLKKYKIFYDKIIFNKPRYHLLIDDLVMRFKGSGHLLQVVNEMDKTENGFAKVELE